MRTIKKKVLLAMSGGLDSSISAVLLQRQGYEIIGVTMKLWNYPPSCQTHKSACCDVEAIHDARYLAQRLHIPHYVLDFTQQFKEIVTDNFINEYLNARTPNPCILCNTHLKWKALMQKAEQLQCDCIATGHYARIRVKEGRYFVCKGKDAGKDQSYVLWGLSQHDLAHTLFPLGDYHKNEIRQMAKDMGFEKLATKRESYDICFIPDNDYGNFLKERIPNWQQLYSEGNVRNTAGKIVGKHKGFPFYTIGQRKGLHLAFGVPKYVCRISAQDNEITIGDKADLLSDTLTIKDFNMSKYENLPSGFTATVKIRYRDAGQLACITQADDCLKVRFLEPVSAVTPGQSAVMYEDEDVVGGGIICLA
jgi:tRNA-specific 2-thiouridylase